MGKIVLLDELTINQIAAGEVIERPASVIKEMVENSIDAGAKHITVEIKNGGISYIRVSDDGKGIEKDDVEMAFERHATSKIRSAADLVDVKSMGFRGEALASIAAIANVELVSKTEEAQVGTKITVEGGNVLGVEEVGTSRGTVITVRNLFFNTPVRYKFLKKDFTETGYIEDVMERIALVHPEIAMKLINTGKVVLQTNGNGDIKSVIYSIYGKDIAEELLPVEYDYEYIKVKGVIGKPAIARSNRANQIFFVNKRYIKDKTLTSAVEQGFKGMIPIGKFAFTVLDLEMDPSKVDVNVHPAKLEVRFEEEGVAFKAVYNAIKNTLLSADLISEREQNKQSKEAVQDAFKIQATQRYDIKNDGGLFERKGEKLENIKEEKLPEKPVVDSSSEPHDVFPENMDVFERLRKLQEELKMEIANNPEVKLTDGYKHMEEKYNEMTNTAETIMASSTSNTDMEKTQVIDMSKIQTVDTANDDIDKTQVISTTIDNTNIDMDKTQVVDTSNVDMDKTQVIETSNEEPEEASKVEPDSEKQENVSSEKKIEQMEEQMLSFEQMYKELFGKEPYGGRRPVEEVKKEEFNYDEDSGKVENLSVFESTEEYGSKPKYRFIGIAFKTYIILEMNNELYLMDQHAAHERILYEKVKENYYKDTEKESQLLLLPDIITLTAKEMDIARENFAMFEKAGFILEEFGENTIKISGVPEICVDLDTKELFLETLDEINTVARTAKQEKEDRFLATVACKSAVKANMDLSPDEVTSIMDQLLLLPNPFTCPHGRPTVIKMTRYEIERKFARK